MINSVKSAWLALWQTVKKFYEDNMLSYSASIAFFTIFSFPGVFIVMMLVSGFFFNEETVRQEVYEQIKGIAGVESATEIRSLMQNISIMQHSSFAALIGLGTVLFGATSVFASIQDGLNVAWGLRPKPRRLALKFLINRLLSLAIVLSIGFILLVSLVVDTLLVLFQDFWTAHLPGDVFRFIEVMNSIFSGIIITILFLLVYRFLPNGKVALKFLLPGSLFSMALFVLGKYIIGIYLGNSSVGTAYGAAGSLVVLLVWVFYSSIVLLFGAQLIATVLRQYGGAIRPDEGVVKIITKEL